MSFPIEIERLLVQVTEEEIWQMEQNQPDVTDNYPSFYCIARNGMVRFFPPLKPGMTQLKCTVGK